jgi:hypothetical protein
MEVGMAGIASQEAQQLLDEIESLKGAINSIGEAERTKLADIVTTETKVMSTITLNAGKVDDTAWTGRTEPDQRVTYNRLLLIRDSLRSTVGLEGPSDRGHLMSGTYASNFSISLWLGLSFVLVGLLLYGVVSRWNHATSTDFADKLRAATDAISELDRAIGERTNAEIMAVEAKIVLTASPEQRLKREEREDSSVEALNFLAKKRDEVQRIQEKTQKLSIESVRALTKGGASEEVVLGMVILLGALGGTLHVVGSLVMYIGNGQLKRRWLPYYLSIPIVGAALAPIVYMLLRVGILTPSGVANGGTATSNLNLVAIYSFAALTGMFAKTATDKLGEVFDTIFRTSERTGKDRISSEHRT